MEFRDYLDAQPRTPLIEAVTAAYDTLVQPDSRANMPGPDKVVARDRDHLLDLIAEEIKAHGYGCSLNHIDVSQVTDMDGLFRWSPFNGDISKWDVSNVHDMSSMFDGADFNGDISKWNVSNVIYMNDMFYGSKFDGDISNWDVSNVTDMTYMFAYSVFSGDISKWDVSNVTDMDSMFANSLFNGDISKWNVSNVTGMYRMFNNSKFNGDIQSWLPAMMKNGIKPADIGYDSFTQKINGTLTKIDVDSITEAAENLPPRQRIFARDRKHLQELICKEIKANGPTCSLNHIDVSWVSDMVGLFMHSPFNGDISQWDVSNVTDMNRMFYYSKFNGDISKWDVSNVTDMRGMFVHSNFNGDISGWDVSKVEDMTYLFDASKFKGNIASWIPAMMKNGINPADIGCKSLIKKINNTLAAIDVDSITD